MLVVTLTSVTVTAAKALKHCLPPAKNKKQMIVQAHQSVAAFHSSFYWTQGQ